MFRFATIPLRFLMAFGAVVRHPRLLRLCVAPWLLAGLTFVALTTWAIASLNEVTAALLSLTGLSDFWLFSYLGGFVAVVVMLALSAVASILVAVTLGGYFLERIVVLRLLHSGVVQNEQELESPEWVRAIVRGVRDDVLRLLMIGAIVLSSVLLGFVPVLQVVPLLLAFVLTGFDVLDSSLTIYGLSFRDRLRLLLRHKLQVLVFGACLTGLLVVPFLAILAVPVAYAAAADTVASWDLPPPPGRQQL